MAAPGQFKVDLADRADIAAVLALVRKAYGKYVARIGKAPGPMLDDYASHADRRHLWVLRRGGEVVGVLVLLDCPGYLLLDNIAVDPASQGQGLGRRLVEFAEAEARRRGYTEIHLYTHEKMVENIDLYRGLGYEESHRAVQSGYARVFMRKYLKPNGEFGTSPVP